MTDTQAITTVLIVEDHPMVAQALSHLLGDAPDLLVEDTVANGADALRLAAERKPDVVIMDYHLPGGSGAQAAAAIRAASPDTSILFFSADDSDVALFEAVEAGASGYLHKGSYPDLVLEAVRRVATGEMLIPAADLSRLISAKRAAARSAAEREQAAAQFTERERELLLLMRDGLDNAAVAQRMFIELTTVRWHIRNILEKLGAHTKLEAVARAAELGLIEH